MKEIKYILQTHRAFSYAIAVILFLLLARIPFGTFNEGSGIDTAAHFALPALAAPLLYTLLQRMGYLPNAQREGLLLIIVLLGVSAEVLWEIFEYSVDRTFGLMWQLDNTDTMQDLMLSVVGSVCGGYLYSRVYGSTAQAAELARKSRNDL